MKITLDLSKLVEEGRLTPADAERLKALAAHDTGNLGLTILTGFGVIAASVGAVAVMLTAFNFSASAAAAIGGIVFAVGLLLRFRRGDLWSLLSQTLIIVGALTGAGGLLVVENGSLRAALVITAAFAATAVLTRSSLMAALSVVSLAGCLGARTGYVHAMYSLSIQEPTVTIVLFSALALALYLVSLRVRADYERIAIAAARMSVVLVNFGFWIGSLWGDNLRLVRALFLNDDAVGMVRRGGAMIPSGMFSIGWALALIAVGVWGVRSNRRWVVNVAAVFAGIHFYTQWFSILGPNAFSVLAGGILMIAAAFALRSLNKPAPLQPAV